MSDRALKLDTFTAGRRAGGGKLLVPFLTAGYPDREGFSLLLQAVADAGCGILEIGMPFSDPVADGPVIQAASQQALAGGVTLPRVLEMAAEARDRHGLLVVLMGYLNPILHFGPEKFAAACGEAGVAGLIVPDLPHEESGPLRDLMAGHGTALIELLAPTTDRDRMVSIGRVARGFLYLVSTTGVTGSGGPDADVADYLARVREACGQPACVGFGISDAATAARVCRHADGVVIGSALLRLVAAAPDGASAAAAVREFLMQARTAIGARGDKS